MVQGQVVQVQRLGVGVERGCEHPVEVENGSLYSEESLGTDRNCRCLESGQGVSADLRAWSNQDTRAELWIPT